MGDKQTFCTIGCCKCQSASATNSSLVSWFYRKQVNMPNLIALCCLMGALSFLGTLEIFCKNKNKKVMFKFSVTQQDAFSVSVRSCKRVKCISFSAVVKDIFWPLLFLLFPALCNEHACRKRWRPKRDCGYWGKMK